MARSVSTPSGAEFVIYLHIEEDSYHEMFFDEFLDDLRSQIMGKYGSFTEIDRWAGREDHAILENRFGYVTVSEYMGLVAVAFVVDTYESQDLAEHWAGMIESGFREAVGGDQLVPVARASNGEQFFKRVAA